MDFYWLLIKWDGIVKQLIITSDVGRKRPMLSYIYIFVEYHIQLRIQDFADEGRLNSKEENNLLLGKISPKPIWK